MQKKTMILLPVLMLILLVGGAFAYNQLLQKLDGSPASTQPEQTQEETTAPTQPLVEAPDFTVYDLQGNPVCLSDFRGKPVIFNIWASWDNSSKSEMDVFQKKYLEYGEQIQFLMIDAADGGEETVESAMAFVNEKGYTFPVYFDQDTDAAVAYSTWRIPVTYFIDADGYAAAYAGGAIDEAGLQKGIDMIYPANR